MRPERRFPPEASSVPAARDFVMAHVGPLDPTTSDAVRVMVSELVTNAVNYGGPPISVGVERTKQLLRIEVMDQGSGSPQVQPLPGPSDLHGRGLYIVRELADNWGIVQHDPRGKAVWFEIKAE